MYAKQVEGERGELQQDLECTTVKKNSVEMRACHPEKVAVHQNRHPPSPRNQARGAERDPTNELLEGLLHGLKVPVDLLQCNNIRGLQDILQILHLLRINLGVGVLRQGEASAIPSPELQRDVQDTGATHTIGQSMSWGWAYSCRSQSFTSRHAMFITKRCNNIMPAITRSKVNIMIPRGPRGRPITACPANATHDRARWGIRPTTGAREATKRRATNRLSIMLTAIIVYKTRASFNMIMSLWVGL
jgi:hypothetical protein